MDSLTINMIFGYQYTKVQNCEYVPLGLELKQYILVQAFTLCWYLDISQIIPLGGKCNMIDIRNGAKLGFRMVVVLLNMMKTNVIESHTQIQQ